MQTFFTNMPKVFMAQKKNKIWDSLCLCTVRWGERACPRQRFYEKPNTTWFRLEGSTRKWEHESGTFLICYVVNKLSTAIAAFWLAKPWTLFQTPKVSTWWGSCICYLAQLQGTAPAGTPPGLLHTDAKFKPMQVKLFTVEKDDKFM